jgi:hypothetical protein
VTGDIVSLAIQAAGGGIASTANTTEGANQGAQIMVGGVMWQMSAFVSPPPPRVFHVLVADSRARPVVMVAYTVLLVEFIVRYVMDAPVSRQISLFGCCRRGRRARAAAARSDYVAADEADGDKEFFTDLDADDTTIKRKINVLLTACALSTVLIFVR